MTVYTAHVVGTLWGAGMLCDMDAYILWAYTMTNIHGVGQVYRCEYRLQLKYKLCGGHNAQVVGTYGIYNGHNTLWVSVMSIYFVGQIGTA